MRGILSGLETVRKRRVFFSFHYQNDIWRVNQIRQSWRYQHESQRETEGFFDASIWESAKRTSPEALKTLIRESIKNTSVTCVLAGAETYQRRWVRYEIARSVVKGNGLLTVKIHSMLSQNGVRSAEGDDPLAHMGVYRATDGRVLIAEMGLTTGKWQKYADFTQAVTLPRRWQSPTSTSVVPISRYAHCHDYARQDGRANFASWIRAAAEAVAA